MSEEQFRHVRDVIEDTPGNTANMRARAKLICAIAECIRSSGMTQAEAARLLGVTQPRISNLMCGRIDVFSLDMLVNMLAALKVRLEMRLEKTT